MNKFSLNSNFIGLNYSDIFCQAIDAERCLILPGCSSEIDKGKYSSATALFSSATVLVRKEASANERYEIE